MSGKSPLFDLSIKEEKEMGRVEFNGEGQPVFVEGENFTEAEPFASYDQFNRTTFIRDLTRELFLERAKGAPSGKISPDYAKLAYEGAVSVADVLGLED